MHIQAVTCWRKGDDKNWSYIMVRLEERACTYCVIAFILFLEENRDRNYSLPAKTNEGISSITQTHLKFVIGKWVIQHIKICFEFKIQI